MAKPTKKRTTRSARSNGDAPGSRHADRREQLINLAVEVFGESGFNAGTTTEIARRAGLTQPALYHYVGSKEVLLAEICHRMGSHLNAVLESVLEGEDLTPTERLVRFIDGYTRTVINEAGAMSVRATEVRHLPTKIRNKIYEEERAYLHAVEKLVAGAREDGGLPDDVDPWVTTRALLGMMNWTYIWYRSKGVTSEDEIVDALVKLVIRTA